MCMFLKMNLACSRCESFVTIQVYWYYHNSQRWVQRRSSCPTSLAEILKRHPHTRPVWHEMHCCLMSGMVATAYFGMIKGYPGVVPSSESSVCPSIKRSVVSRYRY